MSDPIRIADLRTDDIDRYALAIEGLALGHWSELPRAVEESLPNVRAAAEALRFEVERIAAVFAIQGVEGVEGVELVDWEDDEEGENGDENQE